MADRRVSSSATFCRTSESNGALYFVLSAFAFLCGWALAKLRVPNHDRSQNAAQVNTAPEDQPSTRRDAQQAPAPLNQTYFIDRRKNGIPSWKKWTEIGAVAVAFGLLLVNILLLGATKKAADAAKNAAEISRDTFQLTYRPRLKIVGLTQRQTSTGNGPNHDELDKGRLTVSIDVPNLGPFAARNVRFFAL